MEERQLLYALIAATLVNTVILIILVAILIKLAFTAKRVLSKAEDLLDQGQREILSTIATARTAIGQGGNVLGKLVPIIERYMIMSSFKKLASTTRFSKFFTGIGIGYGIIQSLRRFWGNH